MCSRVTCPKCNKPDWRGCGAHIESVLGDVPKAQRCSCEKAAPGPGLLSSLGKLFGGGNSQR